jgi:hypothetical protein
MKDKIPTWILVWSALMFLLPFGFGIVGYLNPAYFGPEWAHADAMKYAGPFGLYVGRNMASAVIMMLALTAFCSHAYCGFDHAYCERYF